jgi:3-isopropylmalate dehydrogenase
MKKRIAVVPGDGIGPEVTREATKVLVAAAQRGGHQLELEDFDWGAERYLRDGTTLPEGSLEVLQRDFDAILVGALGDPRVPDMKHAKDILFGMRFGLDLYANVRPVKLLHPSLTPLKDHTDIDLVIFRENTEGLYVGVGGNFKQGTADEVAVQEDVNTRKGVERILRAAYDYARAHGRKRLCMSDKSNALAYGHGLWQRVFAELAPQYPEIESSHLYVDNLALQMVREPTQFEVIVTCNLFGDILSDLGAGLVGGLGLAPSANINPDTTSMFEPVHGSAPPLAGKNVANPLAAILAAAMLADHLGLHQEAGWIEEAVRASLEAGKTTEDLGGSLKTSEVGDWVAGRITA